MKDDLSKRLLTPKAEPDERASIEPIRPQTLDDFIGQSELKKKLAISIQAAKKREEALDHILLSGPPGLGKTTLAHIIAEEMGSEIRTTSGPVLERKADLAGLLTEMQPGDVLFIDEIHRLNRLIEECLYPAMEDFFFDILIGEGAHAKSVKIDLPPFCLVGATTRSGMLTGPLRDRFGIQCRLNFYEAADINKILTRSARILQIEFEADGIMELSSRSRRTPRVANRLLRRVRDYAQVCSDGTISKTIAQEALDMLEIDDQGLDQMDRQILLTIIEKFDGGPVGIRTIATALGEDEGTIEEVYEPYMIQEGFLNRTPNGRVVTPKGYRHLKVPIEKSNDNQPPLFEDE